MRLTVYEFRSLQKGFICHYRIHIQLVHHRNVQRTDTGIFWNGRLCSLVEAYRRFGELYHHLLNSIIWDKTL
jgi:hypothetical protein